LLPNLNHKNKDFAASLRAIVSLCDRNDSRSAADLQVIESRVHDS